MKKVLNTILFSNSFYGIVAVALAIENNLVLKMPLNHPLFYVLLFCGTVAFYLLSYRYDRRPHKGNKRAFWIGTNRKQLIRFQYLLAIIIIAGGTYYIALLPSVPLKHLLEYCFLISIFPILGFLYYGISYPGLPKIRLRSLGWFKPFIIGAVWAGSVSFIPWLLFHWMHKMTPTPSLPFIFFGLHNWMYISVLAILFDIKDYAADHNQSLKTFVVRKGLRYVIFTIVLPLTLLGTAILVIFFRVQGTSPVSIAFSLVPMLLLGWVALSLSKRRPITWYLLVIDGLMLVKAIFGMVAVAAG